MNDDSRAYTYPQDDCRSYDDFHPKRNPHRVPYSWEELDSAEMKLIIAWAQELDDAGLS